MTQEEFIEILKKKGYFYEIEGDNIVVLERGGVDLGSLTSLPSGVVFKNRGDVFLESLKSLPPDVVFRNEGAVSLGSLTSLHPGVEFNNKGGVWLKSLTSIPPGVEFRNINGGEVNLNSIIGGWFFFWKGNIKGIDSNRLLNKMISKEMFI
jgi:hypothetical protein